MLSCRGPHLALPARDNSLEGFDPRKSVFLDIETTGLSGGTGTWAFLIGLGMLKQDHFLLRQYFLRRPTEERSILSHFAAEADRYPTMITFNGKLFDLPLIQTRQLLAGFKQTVPAQHLDLLQCARTLWKKRLTSRSLRSIEESLLGLRRFGDIPGVEIPAVYFDYLRRGKTAQLKQVFHHNVLDILSMVTLLERISCLGAGEKIEHPVEALALGKLCLETGRSAEGLAHLEMAAAASREDAAQEAALELAIYHKRAGHWPQAVEIWQRMISVEQSNPAALIALAKYYEHQAGEYNKALDLTEAALKIIKPNNFQQPASGELSKEALLHRKTRLLRKTT
jgi:tetratricopeptide (TPR) repeat protein